MQTKPLGNRIDRFWVTFCLSLILLLPAQLHATIDVTYRPPTPTKQERSRVGYPVELLRLALQESDRDYHLKPVYGATLQSRTLKEIELNHQVDVSWSMTSKERERLLIPIRIPIFKGLFGCRIFLAHKEIAPAFTRVRDLQGLTTFTSGQGHDWPDSDILSENGITVFRSPSYEGLFKMVAAKRIDFFPRSLLEIWEELDHYDNMALVVVPRLAIQYPAPIYYFVRRGDDSLAKDIQRGLESAIAKGLFERLFREYNQVFIERSELENRHLIRLSNPYLPEETPLERKELWHGACPASR